MGGFSYIHFNKVEKQYEHDKILLNISSGYRIWGNNSVFVNYSYPLNTTDKPDVNKPVPNLSFGIDISTHAHQYQIFLTNQEFISIANAANYNSNKISFNNLRIAFNIILKFGK
jgi:hypothetical protein